MPRSTTSRLVVLFLALGLVTVALADFVPVRINSGAYIRIDPYVAPPDPPIVGPAKMKVTFSGYSGSESLTMFPALVVFSNSIANFYSNFINTNGIDLRFKDETQTGYLNYEIETWDPSSNSYVWVQVPTLTNNAAVWAYWGDTLDSTQVNYATNGATWTNGFACVWHLNETGTANRRDSASNHVGTTYLFTGDEGVAGMIANGCAFGPTHTNSINTTYSLGSMTSLSVTAWVKTTDTTTARKFTICDRANGNWTNLPMLGMSRGSAGKLNWGIEYGANGVGFSPVNTINNGAWRYLAGTWSTASGSVPVTNDFRVFIDGVPIIGGSSYNTGVTAVSPFTSTTNATIGHTPGNKNDWNSWWLNTVMDEIRVSIPVRSTNWIWAEYLNSGSNSVFNSYGLVQSQ